MAAARIAFIGLGVMGYPMAGWLSSKGHSITVYNRTGEVAERWISQHSGDLAQTPQQAAAAADIIFTCVGNDNDLSEVLMGEQGVMAGIKQGALLVDHTTTSAELAKQIDVACRAANCGFVDAPVSGGQQGAENGQLTVMCGGDPEHFAEVQPLLACYAKEAQLMGPAAAVSCVKWSIKSVLPGWCRG